MGSTEKDPSTSSANIAGASARWLGANCPTRTLSDSVAENSAMTHSLMASSPAG